MPGYNRRLNAVTRKYAFPFASIEDIVSNVGGATYFTTLDASKGFHQVEMEAGDQTKMAFVYHRGLFEFPRMPLEFYNAPGTFHRLVYQVLGDGMWQFALGFLDDI